MAGKKKRNRWINNGLLLCLLLIPALFWYFAANMTIYRYEARQLAEKINGTVVEQTETEHSCKDSDGRRRTCTDWTYTVRFQVQGDQITRPLLDARFDPKYDSHTDGVDHEAHGVGATMPLLLRRDLDFAVAPDFFWSAYLMPVILAGFGLFVSFFMVVAILLGWEKAPYRSPSEKNVQKRTVTRN